MLAAAFGAVVAMCAVYSESRWSRRQDRRSRIESCALRVSRDLSKVLGPISIAWTKPFDGSLGGEWDRSRETVMFDLVEIQCLSRRFAGRWARKVLHAAEDLNARTSAAWIEFGEGTALTLDDMSDIIVSARELQRCVFGDKNQLVHVVRFYRQNGYEQPAPRELFTRAE